MRAAYDKYRGQGFEVLSISIGEERSDIADFVDRHGLEYPFLLDRTGLTSTDYGVTSTPTTYFVAPDGTITDQLAGVVSLDWLEQNLEPFVST